MCHPQFTLYNPVDTEDYTRNSWHASAKEHNGSIHKENLTRCNSISKFYFIFMWSSTCFGRHTAHHQEPKTALAVSGFAYWRVVGRVVAVHWQRPATTQPTTLHVCKTRSCYCSFRLLMMGGVSPKTCWALYKYKIKFWYTVASCWIYYMNYFVELH